MSGEAKLMSAAVDLMTEADWQSLVVGVARLHGWMTWHTRDSRGSDPGWPDLVLARPATGEVIFVELKSERGKVTISQQGALDALAACGVETAVWRPSDEAAVMERLRKRRAA